MTVAGWHGCDHVGPVHEGNTLRSDVTVEDLTPLPAGGGLVGLRSRVRADATIPAPDGRTAPTGGAGEGGGGGGGGDGSRDVLDWRFVAVLP
ncbi:hypothetical protein [Parafrankia sp. EUN1f]|uniref:hypothetical protein n=1 Tax=Parafrankia sp. EUN1f TaxID=102897 RepID=UPI0001C44DF2|nr:hypothetical protein [Parafrankia sp. EUN1f]EFC84395.1 hypothetical protein FrEUN1fDRAFT_2455 [Parafrankia sp. EUN1f]